MLASRACYLLARDLRDTGSIRLWLLLRGLSMLVLASLLLLLCSVVPARAAQPEHLGQADLNTLQSGQLLLQDAPGGTYAAALLQASKVHVDISGMIATVALEQSFSNDSQRWFEGVYAFPLPEGAAVRTMEMVVGERRIIGKIREKTQAQEIYRQAKQAGKKASLVEQQRPNLFTNRVANIAPGERITVRLEYVQPVTYVAGEFSLRLPTTITPRYMPGAPLAPGSEEEQPAALSVNPYLGWAVPTDQVPDADAISPPLHPRHGAEQSPLNPIAITARLDMGMPLARVASAYHDIAMERRAGVYTLRLAGGVSEMDRDFVLNWRPVTGAAPVAALFGEQVGDEHFGLLLVVPPAPERAPPAMPRKLIFVVDTSGSMGGVSIAQARESVASALQQLRPEDRFNVIQFNSTHHTLFPAPVAATPGNVQRALAFVRQLDASGGTEMLGALRAALAPPGAADPVAQQAPLTQVVFITDGAVGNEAALFREIASRLGENRLFTVGIGSAPNSWFMRKAAQFGRGSYTHIGEVNEVDAKMTGLFARLARPAAVNLTVDWPVPVETWPERLPDLYHGEPLVVAVNFGSAPPAGEVVVRAELGGQHWSTRLQVAGGADPATRAQHDGVASLWARYKIAGLLDQLTSGRSEASVREAVLAVALQHQLLSPYTSFIAVEQAAARPASEDLARTALANTAPRGQSPQTFAYPATATTGPAKFWFGLLLLFVALLVHLLRQSDECAKAPAPR